MEGRVDRGTGVQADIQGDQKVSVHLMIRIQKVTSNVHTSFLSHYLAQSDCLVADRQG
jgi:hypothetical protein